VNPGSDPDPRIAIVGSGPAGCYAAQFLHKEWPNAPITIFERLPVPYGLLRYGVAPDHQGTKAVVQQFERLFAKDPVYFHGNIEIGRDITLGNLRAAFDVVVLATGLTGDRSLGIPGSDLPGVIGAGRITRLLNEHPEEPPEGVAVGRQVMIIGNGNVAIDVIRLLVKPDLDFAGSDLDLATRRRIAPQRIESVDVLGRSPAHSAKFDPTMIAELARIPGVRFIVRGVEDGVASDDPRVRAIAELALDGDGAEPSAATTVTFHFGWIPESIVGSDRVRSVIVRPTTGTEPCLALHPDTVITAIGFERDARRDLDVDALPDAEADPDAGRLAAGLYGVGWCAFGSGGNIPDNRARSRATVQTIVADVTAGHLRLGKPGRESLDPQVLAGAVDYRGWRQIDARETRAAPAGMVRRKIKDIAEMLEAAGHTVDGAQPRTPAC